MRLREHPSTMSEFEFREREAVQEMWAINNGSVKEIRTRGRKEGKKHSQISNIIYGCPLSIKWTQVVFSK